MPRIRAATVPEHRELQRRALLDAARELLAESGEAAPGMAAVAERAGMSRPSVYQYFASKEDLLDAVIEDTFPRWSRRVAEAMSDARTPADRVLGYVDVNLALVAEGEHAVGRALAASANGEVLAERSAAMHEQLRTPLLAALRELGADQPEVVADLVGSLVYSGSLMVESGTPVDEVRGQVTAMLSPYLETTAAGRRDEVRAPGSTRRRPG